MSLVGTVARRVRNAAPVAYVGGNTATQFGGWFRRTNQTSHMEAYGAVGTLFGTVSAITTAVAKQEWWLERVSLQRRVYGPAEQRARQVLVHPAIQLWDNPNPFMSRAELVEVVTQHLMLAGELYLIIIYAGGIPVELWPVRPDWMTPVPSQRDFLAGYLFTGPDGSRIPFETHEVIQVKLPNPLDPYRGMSPVQSLLADLQSAQYSAEWNRRFFLNDATPGGVLKAPAILTDTQFRQARDRWSEQHRGVANAHRTAIIENMEYQSLGYTQRDMQFTELRRYTSDLIREPYRVHKALLGQSDDVNRANAEAASDQMAEWVAEPTLARLAGALNTRLLPLYGQPVNTRFCFSSPVQGDQAAMDASLSSKAQTYSTLVAAGVLPEDAAEVAGLPPMRLAVEGPEPEVEPEEIVPV